MKNFKHGVYELPSNDIIIYSKNNIVYGYNQGFESPDSVITLGGFDRKTQQSNPISIDGYYLGYRDYDIGHGPKRIQFFRTRSGFVGVWSKTAMSAKLAFVDKGTYTRVSVRDLTVNANMKMQECTVQIDPDDKMKFGRWYQVNPHLLKEATYIGKF